jgi:hypothetical protein
MNLKLIIFLVFWAFLKANAQSITLSPGLGTNANIKTDLALPRTKRIFTSTDHIKINTENSSVLVFENGGVLHSIENAKDGKLLLIFNGNGSNSTTPLTIKSQSASEANPNYRIITPDNNEYVVGNGKGGVLLMYDGTAQRWRVTDNEAIQTNDATKVPWKLTGNAGTNPASNFVGTRDSSAFAIKMLNKDTGIGV